MSKRSEAIVLFRNWETYQDTLPQKMIKGDSHLLGSFPFFANDEDLFRVVFFREPINFIVAGSGSGKTSSVLSAFLASHSLDDYRFAHYVYISFQNKTSGIRLRTEWLTVMQLMGLVPTLLFSCQKRTTRFIM